MFTEYDPGNLLLHQARREVLERQFEAEPAAAAPSTGSPGPGSWSWTTPGRRPLAFPLLVARMRETLSSEKLADRVRRMQARLEKAASR